MITNLPTKRILSNISAFYQQDGGEKRQRQIEKRNDVTVNAMHSPESRTNLSDSVVFCSCSLRRTELVGVDSRQPTPSSFRQQTPRRSRLPGRTLASELSVLVTAQLQQSQPKCWNHKLPVCTHTVTRPNNKNSNKRILYSAIKR